MQVLGQGQFGTTRLVTELATGEQYACKSISKKKLKRRDEVEDVKREVQVRWGKLRARLEQGKAGLSRQQKVARASGFSSLWRRDKVEDVKRKLQVRDGLGLGQA